MRRIIPLALAALLLAPGPVLATTVLPTLFTLTAVCTAGCEEVGAEEGSLGHASFLLSTEGFSPSGEIVGSDLLSFDVQFGDVSFTESASADMLAYGTWGSSSTELDSFALIAATSVNEEAPGLGFALLLSQEFLALASPEAFCEPGCQVLDYGNREASYTELASFTAVPIPLPAAGWLLLGGIAILGGLKLRRRA